MNEYRVFFDEVLETTPQVILERLCSGLLELGVTDAIFDGVIEIRLSVPREHAELVEQAASIAGLSLHRIRAAA